MEPASWPIEALNKGHDRDGFRCGTPALDRYLQQQARQDADRRIAAPFVLVEPPSPIVKGFYTLSASVIGADELPAELARKLPRYGQLPVTLLGRLAVDLAVKGRGIGQFLLLDALHRSLQAASGIAAMAVVVDAKDDAAAGFYQHFGFMPLQERPRRLFLSMKTVAGLLA